MRIKRFIILSSLILTVLTLLVLSTQSSQLPVYRLKRTPTFVKEIPSQTGADLSFEHVFLSSDDRLEGTLPADPLLHSPGPCTQADVATYVPSNGKEGH